MKKRIFAGLLTLVMVFTLLPVSALAAGVTVPVTVNEGRGTDYGGVNKHTVTLNKGKPTTAYVGMTKTDSVSKLPDQSGSWKLLPIYNYNGNHYTPTDYAVDADNSVTVSKEGIIGDLTVDLVQTLDTDYHRHQCVQLSYKALAAGTVTVQFKYYYNFGLVNYNTKWYQGTGTATITVIGKPTSTPNVSTNKFEDVIKFKCDTDDSHNATADFNDSNVTNGYSYGEIIDNDGENSLFPVSTYPWMCVVTLNTQAYLDGYNKVLSGKNGTHYLAENQGAEETFTFYYSKNDGTWWYDKGAFPVIDITCTEPNPEPDPKPDKPGDTKPDFEKENVNIRVQCIEYPSMHDPYKKSYGLLPDAYTDKGVTENKGTYFYTIELDKAKYIAQFDQDIGKPHTDTEPNEKTYIEWRWENGAWHLIGGPDGVDADIKVKCSQTETPPEAPTDDELKKLEMAVQVKCVVDNSQQHTEAYGLLGECDGDYFVGEPRKDGDDWLCDISYVPDLYVAKFNTAFQNLKHVQNDEKTVPVTLIWAGDSWQLKTQGRVHVTEEYTVTFNAYGGFPTPDKQHVKSGEKAVLPVAPTLKGYTFAFWYLGEDEQTATAYDFDTPVTGDITLTAKWNINKYTVTFDSYGGTPVPPKQEVEYGRTATEPTTAPTKTGYTFDGWYLGDEKYDFSDAVEQNITLRAKWEAKQVVNVVIYRNGNFETPYKTVELDKQSKGTVIDLGKLNIRDYYTPNATGKYEFYGWYNDGTWNSYKKDPANAPDGLNSVTVNGWTNIIAMVYDYEKVAVKAVYDNDKTGAKDIFVGEALHGSPLKAYLESNNIALDQPGYTHTEWYNWDWYAWEDHAVGANAKVNGWTNVYVAYKAIPYGVTYSYHNSVPAEVMDTLPTDKGTYTVKDQVPVQIPTAKEVAVDGYKWTFKGWQLDGKDVKSEKVNMTVGGLHFKGIWECEALPAAEYPVTYSYVSGTEGAALPGNVNDSLPVNENTYTIGQQVPTAAKPANVTVGDYIWSLKAWKLGDNEIVPNNSVPMVEGGLNFVGIWTREKATVTVTFDANGGTVAPTSKTITKGSTLTLPTPVLSGYSFDGWFTEKTGGTQVNAGATFDKDTTLYAHWTKKSSSGGGGSSSRDYDYTLRYVTNGGKSIASETKSKRWTKDYEDLPMPTRAGYRFDGWYYDSALKNEVTGDVKVNSRTVTLYAGWIGSSVPDSLNGEDHFAYVQGYADGTVRPNTPVTRAQVATILFRLLDESVRKEYLTENNTFTDVASNYWANTAISTMANMGVFKGRTADRFDPNAPITRGEFAAVCARFDDSKVKTTETYSDIDGYWAANEILRAAALGWVQGYQDGSYRPNNSITRAQVVTMINRVLCRMPEKNADLLKGMSSFTDCAEDDWCYLAIQEATNSHDYKTKSGSIHEKWTDLNTAPDWSRFEH